MEKQQAIDAARTALFNEVLKNPQLATEINKRGLDLNKLFAGDLKSTVNSITNFAVTSALQKGGSEETIRDNINKTVMAGIRNNPQLQAALLARARAAPTVKQEEERDTAAPAYNVFAVSGNNTIMAEAKKYAEMNRQVQQDASIYGKPIPKITEYTAGIVAGTGVIFSVVAGAAIDSSLGMIVKTNATKDALKAAETMVAAMFGDLSKKVDDAHKAYDTFMGVYADYRAAITAYRTAADNQDLSGMDEASQNINKIKPRLDQAAKDHENKTKAAIKANADFKNTVINAYSAALSSGVGSAIPAVKNITLTGVSAAISISKPILESAAIGTGIDYVLNYSIKVVGHVLP